MNEKKPFPLPGYPVDPNEAANPAIRRILRHLEEAIRVNAGGVLAHGDPEFLHRLRVASRRTRSALVQLPTILPKPEATLFRREFRLLGDLTGPLRDLDVWLMSLDQEPYSRLEAEAVTLRELILGDRRAEAAKVIAGLNSTHFQSLLGGWRNTLDDPAFNGENPTKAGRPIGRIACKRISKAFGRLRGSAIAAGANPAAVELHKIRISAKKLRYLLEFFAGLCPLDEVGEIIDRLKQLQDVLGAANDIQVQHSWLARFDRRLSRDGRQCIATALENRLECERNQAITLLADFTGDSNREKIRALLGAVQPRL